jgi:superfamily II DNA helicase RecQ
VLKELVSELTRNETGRASLMSRCILIFSTPELVKANLEDIALLHDNRVLSSIIFDEFDVQSEANEDYRGVYTSLLPSLREKCSKASFMFLSATASNQDLLTIVPKVVLNNQPKMKLFVSHRPLQDSLSLRVERKEDLNQVS